MDLPLKRRGAGLMHETKEHEPDTNKGGYQGEHPLITIRRSGMYVTEAKLRSNLFLTDLPPGNPVGVTGKSAGGFHRGVVETPL